MNKEDNNQNNNQVELLEPVKDEKPFIDKAKLIMRNLKDSRKNKKMIMIVLGVLVAIIALVLFISMKKKYNFGGNQLNEDGTIAVETGTKWGDEYANLIQKEFAGYTQYDVSLVDLDFNDTPEMLVRYQDQSNKDTLKVFYITEGEAFSTKYFHLYSIHMLYSVVDKNVGWYIHISSGGDYGAYTSLDKLINGKAFDSDIKTSTDKLLEEFKKTYVDARYKLVFYQVNTNNFEKDIKTVVERYNTYEKDINNAIDKLKKDNEDREYETPGTSYEDIDNLVVKGCKIAFGTYEGTIKEGDTKVIVYITINRDGTLVFRDVSYKYDVGFDKIVFNDDNVLGAGGNNILVYNEIIFTLVKDENGNNVS